MAVENTEIANLSGNCENAGNKKNLINWVNTIAVQYIVHYCKYWLYWKGGGGTNPFSSSFNHSPSTFLRDILAHLDIMHMIVQGAIFIA